MANNLPKVSEFKLSNGLTVWLSEEHSQPKVSGAVVVKAGAKDSPDTGIAHYFEHMMFKGTQNIGTKDFQAEKPYMDKIITLYDRLGSTDDVEEIGKIQKEINRLSIEQSQYIIPNEFDQLISRFGGSELNAFTSYDNTVYFNSFIPGYLEQWAEINSERLISPVFRLFQNELETVYEEKNMYSDNLFFSAIEKVFERVYKDTPYQYSILGSTKNLKKPSLSEMMRFFETYYVGNNMGLMLCGDFDSSKVLPVLEKTFGRIPAGKIIKKERVKPADIKGKEKMKVKIPIPMVQGLARIYKGAEATSPDNLKIDIICSLLNNENGTGFFDKLIVEHKLLMAMAANVTEAKDCGMIAIGGAPKIMLQTKGSVERMIAKEINRIKKGDFPDSLLDAVKYEKRRELLSRLENTDKRTDLMIENFSQGYSWQDFSDKFDALESLTKQDIMECANRYLGDNFLYASKKFGNYRKDTLVKPALDPIPQKEGERGNSGYYESLSINDKVKSEIKIPDYEKECSLITLDDNTRLYHKTTEANGIFSFRIIYETGKNENPLIGITDQYLSYLGTKNKSFNEFRSELQAIGSSMKFESNENFFILSVDGFDNNFSATIKLINEFFDSPKEDKKILKQIKSSLKVEEKAFLKSNNDLATALEEMVKYGDKSSYLTRISSSDVSKLKENTLIDLFREIIKREKSFHYSGSLSDAEVAEILKSDLHIPTATLPGVAYEGKEIRVYNKPNVYFFDDPKSRQSIIYGYFVTDEVITSEERSRMQLLNYYFGGDMTSVMFQQIREFRSLAYSAHSKLIMAAPKKGDCHGVIEAKLSTQSDKTCEALTLLDKLFFSMPLNEKTFENASRALGNYANNMYPDARSLTTKFADDKAAGYKGSKLNQLKEATGVTFDEFKKIYEKMILNSTPIYVIVGNKKDIDIILLNKHFDIEQVDIKSFYKK